MFRHVMRLTWNRRRANALMMIEVAAAFLVMFILIGIALNHWFNFREPLGYEPEHVWEISVRVDGGWQAQDAAALQSVLGGLRALPQVGHAHGISITPFRNWNWTSNLGRPDNKVRTWRNSMTAGGPEALGIELVDGRFPGRQDLGQPFEAVVINEEFRNRVFGPADNPLGVNIRHPNPDNDDQRESRVVGVFKAFRQRGDYFRITPYVIGLHNEDDGEEGVSALFVVVQPGTPAAFEETILNTVRNLAPNWKVSVTPWQALRERHHEQVLTPLKIMAIVATFLLAMVVLGLIGVLWQDVVRRTQEIGLRRALGAQASGVQAQVVLEMIAVALFGIVIGAFLAVQLPMLEVIREINWRTTPWALGSAALAVIVLVTLSALYPSYLASRLTPAEALRHE